MVWAPYVSDKPALLNLNTFSAHFTDKVMDALRNAKQRF